MHTHPAAYFDSVDVRLMILNTDKEFDENLCECEEHESVKLCYSMCRSAAKNMSYCKQLKGENKAIGLCSVLGLSWPGSISRCMLSVFP